jgi:hypothetical protein
MTRPQREVQTPVTKFRRYLVFLIASVVLLLIVSVNMFGLQSDSTVEWKLTLQDLEHRLVGLSKENPAGIEAWRTDADALRNAIASFASEHPETEIAPPDRLPEKPGVEELAQQLNKLTDSVNQVIKQNPGSPFHLGTATVVVAAEASVPSLVSDSIDHSQISQHNFLNIAKAFDYLPGVEIEHIAPRNEAGLRVRGFTTRGQVPFYVDGIPISVPYDGYVDFNRFLTGDIAQLQVTKGYSSPLLGPNALGGTINLVTNEPVKKFEGEALLGTGSGNTLLSGLRLGSRQQRFFAQGSLDWLQNDFVPLSGKFQLNQYSRLPDITMTDHLNHSSALDNRYTGRVGWTPRGEDEYVFSVITQKGEKGVPLY